MACHSGHQLGPHQSQPSSLVFCGFLVWLLFTFTPLPLGSGIREKWLLRPSMFTNSEYEGWLRALGSILTAVELPHKCEADLFSPSLRCLTYEMVTKQNISHMESLRITTNNHYLLRNHLIFQRAKVLPYFSLLHLIPETLYRMMKGLYITE